jgi:hypothetical protein
MANKTTAKTVQPDDRAVAGLLRLQDERSPYVIELSTELLPRLLSDITAAEKSGFEIGGLLIGSFPKAAALTLRVHDFVLIERNPTDASRFSLTAEQRARLSTTRHNFIQQQTPVLGFFRSHLRQEHLSLSSDDRNLLSAEFRRAIHVALLIRAASPFSAAFFVPGPDGALPATPPIPALQFEAEALVRYVTNSPTKISAIEEPEQTSVDTHSASFPVGVQRRAEPLLANPLPVLASRLVANRRPWIFTVGASLLLLICLSLTAWDHATAHLFRNTAALNLTVDARSNLLEIHWNRHQRDIERAQRASLMIEDSGIRRRLTLTTAQIGYGTLAYQPRGKVVELTLSVPLSNAAELVQQVRWTDR